MAWHVPWRCADEAGDGAGAGVLGHVDSDEALGADGTKEGSKQDGAERGAQRRALRLARGRALRGGHNAACDAKVCDIGAESSAEMLGPRSGDAFSFLPSLLRTRPLEYMYVIDGRWALCV
jgi:hypothetical protein